MSNHGARGSAETGDVKTLLGDNAKSQTETSDMPPLRDVMTPPCVTDGPTRPTDRVDIIVISQSPAYQLQEN